MADLDGVQRVVGGFGSYGAAVFDFKHSDLARGKCPKTPVEVSGQGVLDGSPWDFAYLQALLTCMGSAHTMSCGSLPRNCIATCRVGWRCVGRESGGRFEVWLVAGRMHGDKGCA